MWLPKSHVQNTCTVLYIHSLFFNISNVQNILQQYPSALCNMMVVSYFSCLRAALVLLGAEWLQRWACEGWSAASWCSSWNSAAAGDTCRSHMCTHFSVFAHQTPNLGVFAIQTDVNIRLSMLMLTPNFYVHQGRSSGAVGSTRLCKAPIYASSCRTRKMTPPVTLPLVFAS